MRTKTSIWFTQIILCIAAFTQIACSTVSPKLIIPSMASPGSNGLHSNVYAVIYGKDGSIKAQIVYEAWRVEYNKRMAEFEPGTPLDDHLTQDGVYWRADQTAIASYAWTGLLKRRQLK